MFEAVVEDVSEEVFEEVSEQVSEEVSQEVVDEGSLKPATMRNTNNPLHIYVHLQKQITYMCTFIAKLYTCVHL